MSETSSGSQAIDDIKRSVKALCDGFGEQYWLDLDAKKAYPTEFVQQLTADGFLGCLIPEEYGGSGMGMLEACAVLEAVSFAGAHPGAAHAQMYTMASVLRHGSEEQKQLYLSKIAQGDLRLQSFGVTEPSTGSDTTSLKTAAVKSGDHYIVNGQKVWISRVEHSDIMLLLARTRSIEERQSRRDGLSVFIVDIAHAKLHGLNIKPIDAMINHHACELFFDDVPVPVSQLLGKEHHGFDFILDSMNAERILIAAECIGDARYFLDKASNYAKERVVFGKAIGANQGIAFPLAQAYAQTEAAALMVDKAARLFDQERACGAEANMAKLLAADASKQAGDVAMQTFGGFGLAREYHIERKFRETRLYQVAPISTNLILRFIAEQELGLPRSS